MAVKKLPFAEFKKIYSRVPRLCVEIIVKTNKGIVLTKRSIEPARGRWHIPGGTVLKGENLSKAIRRIAKEELGITVKTEKLMGVIEYSYKNYFSQPIGIAFLVKTNSKIVEGSKNNQAEEIGVFRIIPRETELNQKKFLSLHLGLKSEK